MRPIVLYRKYETEYKEGELEAISRYFPLTCHRTNIRKNDLVIGRYSVFPLYREQEEDILNVGAKLINSYKQHRYIADLGNWYNDLEGLTPRSWAGIEYIDEEGPYILKGETNSIRQKFSTHFYARDKTEAKQVYSRLKQESLLSNQTIWIRKFEDLESFGVQVTGLPIANEWRIFICDGEILSHGFYWSSCIEDIDTVPTLNLEDQEVKSFLKDVISKIYKHARFIALDIAKRKNGSWTVIELNDGQMSGLSENNPEILFSNLYKHLTKDLGCCTVYQ